jgi:hypothetical protein
VRFPTRWQYLISDSVGQCYLILLVIGASVGLLEADFLPLRLSNIGRILQVPESGVGNIRDYYSSQDRLSGDLWHVDGSFQPQIHLN